MKKMKLWSFNLNHNTESTNACLAVLNTIQIIYRFPLGLSIALVSFIGTQMGQKDITKSKQFLKAGIFLLMLINLSFIFLLSQFKETWIEFYGQSNQELKDILEQVFPWMIYGVTITDGIQGTLNGALQGINKINLVFYSTLVAYYVFSIPLVLVFTYDWGLSQGVVGIFQGFGIANLALSILFGISLKISDWEKESEKIMKRIQKQQWKIIEQELMIFNEY